MFETITQLLLTAEVIIAAFYLLKQLHSDFNVYFAIVVILCYLWMCAVVSVRSPLKVTLHVSISMSFYLVE